MSIDPTIYEDQQRTGGSWIKWSEANVGDVRKLVITGASKRQVTDYATGLPQTWDDGSPKQELVLTGTDPDTGDTVNMVIKWWGNMKRAFVAAMNAQPLEVGGTFALQWTGTDEPTRAGMSGAKQWKAQWKAPVKAAIAADDLL